MRLSIHVLVNLEEWRLHNLSGQLVPLPDCPSGEKVLKQTNDLLVKSEEESELSCSSRCPWSLVHISLQRA